MSYQIDSTDGMASCRVYISLMYSDHMCKHCLTSFPGFGCLVCRYKWGNALLAHVDEHEVDEGRRAEGGGAYLFQLLELFHTLHY